MLDPKKTIAGREKVLCLTFSRVFLNTERLLIKFLYKNLRHILYSLKFVFFYIFNETDNNYDVLVYYNFCTKKKKKKMFARLKSHK